MLVQNSQSILLHRMALSETGSLGASHALVAKYRGEQMIAEAVERLDEVGPARDEVLRDGAAQAIDKLA